MPVSSAPTFSPPFFGITIGAAGTVLASNGANSKPSFQSLGSISAPGANKRILFNDAGVVGTDADFTWDKSTNTLAFGSNARLTYGSTDNFDFDNGTGLLRLNFDTLTFSAGVSSDVLVQFQNTLAHVDASMIVGVLNDLADGLGIVVGSSLNVTPFITGGPAGPGGWLVLSTFSGIDMAFGTNSTQRMRIYGDGSRVNFNTCIATQESATAPAITNNSTITTAATGEARVAPAGAVTGIILQSGTFGGQQITVVNESVAANTVTFAAAGTSHVADGISSVIVGLTAKSFVWDSVTALWYRIA